MQATAISITPSLPLHKSFKNPNRSFPIPKFDPFRLSSRRLNVSNCNRHHSAFNFSPRSLKFSPELKKSGEEFVVRAASESVDDGEAVPELKKSGEEFVVKAASESVEDGEAGKGALGKTLALGGMFGLWYLFNIYFNIYNKQVLKVYPHPMTVTVIQFAVGSVFTLLMWTLNIFKRPKISAGQLVAILPLAAVHTMGNLFTNMSLGKVAVSFTHTIKAMEPFFSVLLSILFLGERPTPWVLLSLLPIVGGVALASATEASFNWAGFWSAMASNLTFQSRNVLSKKLMVKKEESESMDNITLFSIITILSFIILAPVAFFTEGVKFTPAYIEAAGLNVKEVYIRSLLAALCFHAYQQVSYMILQKVSPITHSVGNCVKRVVVIVSSVLFFRTPVSPINAIGTGIALAGVFFYSQVKRIKPKAKAKEA